MMLKNGFSTFEIQSILQVQPVLFESITKPYDSIFQFIPQVDSYQFIVEQQEFQHTIKQAIYKSLCYPFFLFFIAMTGIHIFYFLLLPNFKMIFDSVSFSKSMNTSIIENMIVIYLILFWIGIAIVLLLGNYYTHNQFKLYHILYTKYKNNIWVKLISLNIAASWLSLLKLGYSTKQCLEIMRVTLTNQTSSELIYLLDSSLLSGMKIEEVCKSLYLDSQLKMMLITGIQTGVTQSLLHQYSILQNEIILENIKKIAKSIQTLSYLSIGAMMIFMYQILFIPMQYLQHI